MPDVIYEDQNAKVTATMAVINHISYPINGITAVYVWRRKLNIGQLVASACAFLLGFALLSDADTTAPGWVLLAGGALLALEAFRRRPYWLMVSTAGGDKQALRSNDGSYLQKIRGAIEQAVASRG